MFHLQRPSGRLLAIVLLLAASLVTFWRLTTRPADALVGPQRGGSNDLNTSFLAWRAYPGYALEQFGQFPFWNPFSLAGTPYVGNPQSAVFYPPNWLNLLAPTLPALSWILVAHHLFAGIGNYLLCRRYALGQPASLLGGVLFLAAPYYIAHTGEGHYNQVCLVAWFPWIMLAWERYRHKEAGGAAGLVLGLAMAFFCGHVQELFYFLLFLTALTVVDGLQHLRRRSAAEAAQTGLRWAAMGLMTAGLVSIDLLPTWMYSMHSIRGGGMTTEAASRYSLAAANLGQLLNPTVFGGPENYRGPGEFYWETLCYFGTIPLVLAVLGAILAWQRYPVAKLTILASVGLLFAFGDDLPVYPAFHRFVPGIDSFRVPARSLFLVSWSVSLLAAFGLESVVEKGEALALTGKRRLLFSGVVVAVLMFLNGMFNDFLRGTILPALSSNGATFSLITWTSGFLLLGALAALSLLLIRPRHCTVLTMAVIALCLGELTIHASRVLRTISLGSIRRKIPFDRLLSENSGRQFRILSPQQLCEDWEAWQRGVAKAQGYEPVPLGRYITFMAAITSRKQATEMAAGFVPIDLSELHQPLVNFLGIRYALTGTKQSWVPDNWRRVQQGSLRKRFTLQGSRPKQLPYQLYKNTAALPRAFIVGEARRLPSHTELLSALKRIDPRQEVLLQQDVLPSGQRAHFKPASIMHGTANRLEVEVEIDHPGYLVLSETWYPGWRATDNGQPAPILQANGAFRAVPLAAGEHHIAFAYRPPGFFLGACLSIITLGLLLIGSVFTSLRTRSNRSE